MKVFEKVLNAIENKQINGHAVANQKNRLSLAKANLEIRDMLSKIYREHEEDGEE